MRTACSLADIVILIVVTLPAVAAEEAAPRPAHRAHPLNQDGVPNFFKVSDQLYRSAQPSATGMRGLKQLGVETIVNLRSFNSDRDEIGETGLAYEHIYMKAWHPEVKELVRFLQFVTNEKRTPVLVHCQYGADRTGLVCAVYRIAVQGWTREEAISEMTEGGFGFNPVWTNIIAYVRDLDIEQVKKKAGLVK